MFGLINEANFFVVFIALLIISFLLGLIIGMLFNRNDNIQVSISSKQNTPSVSNVNPQPTDPVEQNNNQKTNSPQEQKCKDLRYKYYYYW